MCQVLVKAHAGFYCNLSPPCEVLVSEIQGVLKHIICILGILTTERIPVYFPSSDPSSETSDPALTSLTTFT